MTSSATILNVWKLSENDAEQMLKRTKCKKRENQVCGSENRKERSSYVVSVVGANEVQLRLLEQRSQDYQTKKWKLSS